MKAVLFDMDGVIVDSEHYWEILARGLMTELCKEWSDQQERMLVGLSINGLYGFFKDNMKVYVTRDEFAKMYDDLAETIYAEKTNLMPGFMEFISRLSSEKRLIALVSSSPRPWIDMVIDRFSLGRFFSLTVSADELDAAGKPSPDIYLFAADRLGVSPRDCVVIEDSENGVISAKSAGMFCIGYRNGANKDQNLSGADMIVDSFSKIALGGTCRQ
jgi:HAD superfamily hydrolase (TIGR01509 family)